MSFANGTHYIIFMEKNCFRCKRYINKKGEEICKLEEKMTVDCEIPNQVNIEEMTCSMFKENIIKPKEVKIEKPMDGQITFMELIK